MSKFIQIGFFLSVTLEALAADEISTRALAILEINCTQCHTKALSMSGLDLTSRESALRGGSRGAALTAGISGQSMLIEAIERKGKLAMPPTKALSAIEIETLRRWIDEGAQWTESSTTTATRPTTNWWSFQKVVRQQAPKSGDLWARNAVDEFLLQKLKSGPLKPSPRAKPETLVRRVYMDLWGLQPTFEQVREYADDRSADAWPKLIEKLLASPHYGEKWGRHWLDLVRYSDTAGSEIDSYIQDAWRYRDWVIEAFNNDKPYNRFIEEQIAGDELFPEDPIAHTGTGLYCVGPNRDILPDQADINREETLTDYVDTTSSVFLGLTAGCARCHDHKFDPISQEDHYKIRAVFAPAVKTKVALNRLSSLGYDIAENFREWKLREVGERIRATQSRCQDKVRNTKLSSMPGEVQTALSLSDSNRTQRQRELATQYDSAARVTDDEVRACMTPEESAKLHEVEKLLVKMYGEFRAKPFACGIADWWNVAPRTFLPSRGSRPEKEVQPGFFSILGGGEVPPPAEKRESTGPIPLMPTTGRRAALAKWITNPDNPLTARVMVNRIWQNHFGRGLVATTSDLGTRGGKPTHPELLDWLASEFVSKGWSIKELHRVILTSAAYQQQSTASKEASESDPANLLLSHFPRRRLNADEVRDSVLLATGALNPIRGGRPVVPPLTVEELATFSQRPDDAWVLTTDTSQYSRRSIYMIQKRTFRMPLLEVFDSPDSMLTCPRRESSTTAPQALSLFNSTFTMEHARSLAVRVASEFPSADESAIRGIWKHVLSREPNNQEIARTSTFFGTQSKNKVGRTETLRELIRALLNTNEFLYVD